VTPVEERLRQLIRAEGSIDVARFIGEATVACAGSYYRGRDPFGVGGDFITAPEISQMFGELIGLWAVAGWRQIGAPARFNLVELGPGRGTLMADALRAAAVAQDFLAAADVHLVEVNAALRETQRASLDGYPVTWHDTMDEVPVAPTVLVANEFLDVLPVHQLVATDEGWRERTVALDPSGNRLVWSDRAATPDLNAAVAKIVDPKPGAVYEVAPDREALVADIGRRCAHDTGIALLIDYGHDADLAPGDTLQAVRRHRYQDPLERPGDADLTTHVAFGALVRSATGAGARAWGPVPQGVFLERLGLTVHAERLARTADHAETAAILAARRRLIHPGEMGTLFRVLAITAADAPAPAGFEDES
jgi:NADH dehydrogenase [ubiquinone] 1 alpha subcomplex assembly factor 7